MMQILPLPQGRLSLEFEVEDYSRVRAGLRSVARGAGQSIRFPAAQAATRQEVLIGAERFVLMTDDGTPALLSTTPEGDVLLRATLAAAGRPSRGVGRSHAA